jgi:hypothetical protein
MRWCCLVVVMIVQWMCWGEVAAEVTLYVYAAAEEGGDGTQEKPFVSLQEAMSSSQGELHIIMMPGLYGGSGNRNQVCARRITVAAYYLSTATPSPSETQVPSPSSTNQPPFQLTQVVFEGSQNSESDFVFQIQQDCDLVLDGVEFWNHSSVITQKEARSQSMTAGSLESEAMPSLCSRAAHLSMSTIAKWRLEADSLFEEWESLASLLRFPSGTARFGEEEESITRTLQD